MGYKIEEVRGKTYTIKNNNDSIVMDNENVRYTVDFENGGLYSGWLVDIKTKSTTIILKGNQNSSDWRLATKASVKASLSALTPTNIFMNGINPGYNLLGMSELLLYGGNAIVDGLHGNFLNGNTAWVEIYSDHKSNSNLTTTNGAGYIYFKAGNATLTLGVAGQRTSTSGSQVFVGVNDGNGNAIIDIDGGSFINLIGSASHDYHVATVAQVWGSGKPQSPTMVTMGPTGMSWLQVYGGNVIASGLQGYYPNGGKAAWVDVYSNSNFTIKDGAGCIYFKSNDCRNSKVTLGFAGRSPTTGGSQVMMAGQNNTVFDNDSTAKVKSKITIADHSWGHLFGNYSIINTADALVSSFDVTGNNMIINCDLTRRDTIPENVDLKNTFYLYGTNNTVAYKVIDAQGKVETKTQIFNKPTGKDSLNKDYIGWEVIFNGTDLLKQGLTTFTPGNSGNLNKTPQSLLSLTAQDLVGLSATSQSWLAAHP